MVDIWSFGCVIYNVVAKQVPFRNGRDIKRFCDNRIPFPTQSLQGKLTTNGIDFLQSILVAKPLTRPTAGIALQHPWLPSYDDSPLQESTGSPDKKELAALGGANTENDLASNERTQRSRRPGLRSGETDEPEVQQHEERSFSHSGPGNSNLPADLVAPLAAYGSYEDDETVSRSMQEELHVGGDMADNYDPQDVRAPLARTTETLVGPGLEWTAKDMHEAIFQQMRARQQPRSRTFSTNLR